MLHKSQGPSHAPNIQVHIEELVLRGFQPKQRRKIGEALERELARLFGERGAPGALAKSKTIEGLDAGSVRMKSPQNAEIVGSDLAHAIYGGLRQ